MAFTMAKAMQEMRAPRGHDDESKPGAVRLALDEARRPTAALEPPMPMKAGATDPNRRESAGGFPPSVPLKTRRPLDRARELRE